MADQPYVMHDDNAMIAIALSLSPVMDLDEIQAKLITASDEIRALPIEHPKRQLLAAIRLRERCISDPFYQRKEQLSGIKTWLSLQRSCPLMA